MRNSLTSETVKMITASLVDRLNYMQLLEKVNGSANLTISTESKLNHLVLYIFRSPSNEVFHLSFEKT